MYNSVDGVRGTLQRIWRIALIQCSLFRSLLPLSTKLFLLYVIILKLSSGKFLQQNIKFEIWLPQRSFQNPVHCNLISHFLLGHTSASCTIRLLYISHGTIEYRSTVVLKERNINCVKHSLNSFLAGSPSVARPRDGGGRKTTKGGRGSKREPWGS